MKMHRLKGIIDRITNGVVAVVPDDRTPEVYLPEIALENPREGAAIDAIIIPSVQPSGLARVIAHKPRKTARAPKLVNFSSLVKAMLKAQDKLKLILQEAENKDCDEAILTPLREQISFLAKGIRLFSRA